MDALPAHVDLAALRRIDRHISCAEAAIRRAEPVANAPVQTPGPLVAGRSGYRLGRRLDAENERKARAYREMTEARQRLAYWQSIRKGYLAGRCHPNGQPRSRKAPAARPLSEDAKARRAAVRKALQSLSLDGAAVLPTGHRIAYRSAWDAEARDARAWVLVTAPDGSEAEYPARSIQGAHMEDAAKTAIRDLLTHHPAAACGPDARMTR